MSCLESICRQRGSGKILVPQRVGYYMKYFLGLVLFPPSGRYMAAALLHDYLLQSQLVTRATADHLFLNAMARMGVATWRRLTMFAAVRVFGILKGAFND